MHRSVRALLLLSGLQLSLCAFAPAEKLPAPEENDLVVRFQRVFAPSELPPALRSPSGLPAKCATALVDEFVTRRDDLPPSIVELLERYLAPSRAVAPRTQDTAHFQITYETSGPNAVPPDDFAPANGIPDYVESIGEWAEISWTHHVDTMGFEGPVPAGERVAIHFREMAAYGYTERAGGTPSLVLHRSFQGFPANDDPEGSARGAAKVTVAHELRHACQLAMSGWTEGAWLEADATFVEDRVFDAVNDFVHYLDGASPVSDPLGWAWSGPGYEDCLWEHLLAEVHGEPIATEFFFHRKAHPNEPVLSSFDGVLRARGSSLAAMTTRLAVWSHFCGANAPGRPEGFEEADRFPTPIVHAHVAGNLANVNASIPGMGTQTVLAMAPAAAGRPQLFASGDASRAFAVHAFSLETNGTRRVYPIAIQAGRSDIAELPVLWSELVFLAISVTVIDADASPAHVFVTLDDDLAVGVGELEAAAKLQLLPNRPNPFMGSTTISFSLPAPTAARLLVYDLAGRLVRTLVDGRTFPAGTQEWIWEGDDDRGARVSPGVYAVRLESSAGAASRKVHLLR